MNTDKANSFFSQVYKYGEERGWLRDRNNSWPDKFVAMPVESFLAVYCEVVYKSGFNTKTVNKLFPKLQKAYHDFSLSEVTKMENLDEVLAVVKHKGKAQKFIKGARLISEMGYDSFKKKVIDEPKVVLGRLPWIGPTTYHHLALCIGKDTVKDDLHLRRVAKELDAKDQFILTQYLSTHFGQPKKVIDSAIFEFCYQKAYQDFDCKTLEQFIREKC
jgi:endonuclease III